jgi:biopolymer transport protein TolQ
MEIAHAADTVQQVSVNLNAWDAIWAASPIVQLTLLILAGMSVVCWAIFFSKRQIFKRIHLDNNRFLDAFWKADSLDIMYERLDTFSHSSIARVFKAGYIELQRMAEKLQSTEDNTVPQLTGSDNVHRALNRAIDSEVSQLESRLTVLATTGSTGPFIGLFGTVWGIMGSFRQIGAMKSASLAVVAPGISEALVATAIGLAAAIPAVIAYNHFMTRLRREEIALNNFAADYLNVVKRNFFRDN